ncbi:MAG: type I 3-dehydroquinate dehydratase, partial [Lachnospiraceae bacterium]|nr:type I 3-dehydroquinate dehydratase [Lachnospiraceae bacterium]
MKNTVTVRGVKIGEGMPKIIVPIALETGEEILEAAESVRDAKPDIVEWRADWFDGVFDFAQVEEILQGLRTALGEIPILFTFRSLREGGEKAIAPDAYARLIGDATATGLVDLVDVEIFVGDELAREIIEDAHSKGVKVVASNHDFDRTPDKDELVRRLVKMQEMGADIQKIAVMPTDSKDVLTLLDASEEMAGRIAEGP